MKQEVHMKIVKTWGIFALAAVALLAAPLWAASKERVVQTNSAGG